MYDFISGELIRKAPTSVVIETGGVGYDLRVPLSTYIALPDNGTVRLFTYLHVREDALLLFGFATEEERTAFNKLISVRGVGPGLALTVLSGIRVDEFCSVVLQGQAAQLARIKGIGRKIAERIVLELKDSLADMAAVGEGPAPRSDNARDAMAALVALGYTRAAAREALDKAIARAGEGAPIEDLVRVALKAS